MLLPLGSPLPDDAVSAVRGRAGVLSGLSVPLAWDLKRGLKRGTAVQSEDFDRQAPQPEVAVEAGAMTADGPESAAPADGTNEWDEWNEWSGWEGEAEPCFEIPRVSRVTPNSPAAG